MHVNVRTAACNRASPPRKKNAVHEHAEPQSEREHPRPRRAARRRCSARSSTTSGRARRAPTHDQLERKPRPRGFYPQVRSPSERSDRNDQDARPKRHRGLQRTCHARAARTHIHDNTNKCVRVYAQKAACNQASPNRTRRTRHGHAESPRSPSIRASNASVGAHHDERHDDTTVPPHQTGGSDRPPAARCIAASSSV